VVNRVEFTSTSALNHSVIFLKENDVILTNDMWHVALDLNTNAYEEIISTVKGDLLLVENQKKEFTPISELKQIDSLLNTLEQKLGDFYQILPKLDSRRGLIDFGGTILRTLFGTATLTDLHSLHETLDELKSRNSDIAHSLSSQISYIKNLDSTVKINAAGIANLSNIVKDIVIQSNEHYQQVNRDLMWLNLTLFGQSRIFTAVRELEFTLLQLIQRVDELFAAIQHAIQGQLSVNLINPTTLRSIRKMYPYTYPKAMN